MYQSYVLCTSGNGNNDTAFKSDAAVGDSKLRGVLHVGMKSSLRWRELTGLACVAECSRQGAESLLVICAIENTVWERVEQKHTSRRGRFVDLPREVKPALGVWFLVSVALSIFVVVVVRGQSEASTCHTRGQNLGDRHGGA